MTTQRIADLEAQVTRWEKQFKQWHSERVGLEHEVARLTSRLYEREESVARLSDEKADVVTVERRRIVAGIDELVARNDNVIMSAVGALWTSGANEALAAVRYFILTGIHLQGYGPNGGG